jgi:VacB/RNase II family 3'-5' exoribonuclease
MITEDRQHREILQQIAHRVMLERGLEPDFSCEALDELGRITAPARCDGPDARDLRGLLWCSIDNDDSKDLDQLTVCEQLSDGVRVCVAVADVDSLVVDEGAIDEHARTNTTSVYTAAKIFPMLPEKLSTDLTSLNPHEDRMAMVVEMVIAPDGSLLKSDVYRALVHNQAKLAYNAVAAWLDGTGPEPEAMSAAAGLPENLRMQDKVAQSLRAVRHSRGALTLETIKAKPVFSDGVLSHLEVETQNRAQRIIEDFMIAANGVIARYLASVGFPSVRRVVRIPKRWDRIVELAAQHKYTLPRDPNSRLLEDFLVKAKLKDPVRFPDLSLSVIKLLGPGEYVAEQPGHIAPGHFGLAVKDYAHSTAPNRRYPDLITQRLLKAALSGARPPYDEGELDALARHCTEAEDAANKVERQVGKSAAALLLEDKIGQRFEGIVTGASTKGSWVRLLDIPVEGKLVSGEHGIDVGDRIRVELLEVDVEQGFIDFGRA